MRAHRFPPDAPSEVIAWKCAVCGQWQNDGEAQRTPCPGPER